MADDLNDVIERAAIDLQNMIDTGSIPEDDEGLYEAFGGKKGAGKVSVPKKLTDKQITAYFDFIGTPLTSKSEIASVVSAVRKNMTADAPTTESKKMATPALTKEEKKAVDAFKQIQTTLFPDGDIPSVEQVRANIDSGNFTVRDAFIARMYDTGVPEQPLLAELDDTKEFYSKFEKTFTKNVIGPAPGTLGISNSLNKVNRQGIDFDSSFTQLEKTALDPTSGIKDDFRKTITRPLRSSADNVLQLKLASRGAAAGTRKLAKGAIPPEVLESVLKGIGNIPDPVTRDAVMASLLGYRGTDLSGIRTSRALATRAGTPRPYYDRETGITRDPDVSAGRGRKGAGPDKPPGPVLRAILDRRFDAAGDTGELFPDHDTAKISSALKKYVFPEIPKEVLDNLLKKPTGYTDLRRITASAIANQLGRPDLASQIISHKGEDVIDAVMTGYYAEVEDIAGLQQRGEILTAYEKMMADAVGASDAKGLGEALRLDLPQDFNADYPETESLTRPSGAPVEARVATPEEIAQGEQLRAAKTAEAAATAELAAQEKSAAAEAKMIERAERAPEIVEAERKLAEARAGNKQAAQVASGEDFLAKALKMAKPKPSTLKTVGLGIAGGLAAVPMLGPLSEASAAESAQMQDLGFSMPPETGGSFEETYPEGYVPPTPAETARTGFRVLESAVSPLPGSITDIPKVPSMIQQAQAATGQQKIDIPEPVSLTPPSFLSNPERLRQAREAARSGTDATGFISYNQ